MHARDTWGPLLKEKRSAASGLQVVRSCVSRAMGQLGEALASRGMPLVLPPHGVVLMQLVLNCTSQLNALLPTQACSTLHLTEEEEDEEEEEEKKEE